MRISSGIVSAQAAHSSVKAQQTETTVTNANIRQDFTDPDGVKVEMRPSGDRIHEQAYSMDVSHSSTKGVMVTGKTGSLSFSGEYSFSISQRNSQIDTPPVGKPKPVVIAPIGFEVTNDEIDKILAAVPNGEKVKAIEFKSEKGPDGNVLSTPNELVITYANKHPQKIDNGLVNKLDEKVLEALRGARLVPMRPLATGRFVHQDVQTMELESTSFKAQGAVQTEDGRLLSFDIQVSQTRSFASRYSRDVVETFFDKPISLISSRPVEEMAEQHYILDYDPAKSKSVLSMLALAGGVLSLDKNGDGTIGSASELVGGTTGNAFDELVAYDEDGNGWIDENDSIFTDLMLWRQNDDGTATLVSLLDADVGAISLNHQSTSYGLGSSAKLTGSSVYLKESGKAGVIEQIDVTR